MSNTPIGFVYACRTHAAWADQLAVKHARAYDAEYAEQCFYPTSPLRPVSCKLRDLAGTGDYCDKRDTSVGPDPVFRWDILQVPKWEWPE